MFFSGLDLGQSADYTALTVTEQKFRDRSDQNGIESFYEVRWLQRETLGTPYPDQVRNVSKLYRQAPLKGSKIAVDYTGVGRPVLDLLTEAKLERRFRAAQRLHESGALRRQQSLGIKRASPGSAFSELDPGSGTFGTRGARVSLSGD